MQDVNGMPVQHMHIREIFQTEISAVLIDNIYM